LGRRRKALFAAHQLCWEVFSLNEKDFAEAFRQMREKSKKRNFTQSVELMINFRGIDFKKPQNQIDVRVNLPHATGKAAGKTLLFARDQHFVSEMKGKIDRIILESEIPALKKKEIGQIATDYDALIAEAPVMIAVGKHLGQALAPKGKMPKPVQPDANSALQALRQMSSITRVSNKKGKFMPLVQVVLGSEAMGDKELGENAVAVFNAVLAALPGKMHNIKSVFVKETMGPAIRVGGEQKQ
jgi:large subunit ribosomal protein L1